MIDHIRVTLLGSGSPRTLIDRFGPSTVVEVGTEKFIFDAGRGAMQRLHQLGIPFADITGFFLTHLHSDHVVGFPDLWLTGWLGHQWGGRSMPLPVWGPAGTKEMMSHLEKAYQVDIRARSRNQRSEGIVIQAQDFTEGVIYDKAGVRVTAFKVVHGSGMMECFGFRIDYSGRCAVLSGDTTYCENVIRFSEGSDLLVHEIAAAPAEALRTNERYGRVLGYHTTPQQAAVIFARAKPKLAVYNHLSLWGGFPAQELIPATHKGYGGAVEVGEDLMAIEVDKEPEIHRFTGDKLATR